MKNKVIRVNNMKKTIVVSIQEVLLIAFIILSPIYKCLEDITIVGFNMVTIVIGALLICYVSNILQVINSRQQRFFSLTILVVFCIELLFLSQENSIGWILPILLYVFFLQTDTRVSINKLYKFFLISSIIAAIFSLSVGFIGGRITRAATLVDGSIAPIAITINLFWDTKATNQKTQSYGMLKVLSMFSSVIVMAFGMSRARFLIVAIVVLAFGMSRVINSGMKISRNAALYFIVVLILIVFLFLSGVIQNLFKPIIDRFISEGLDSMGRDVEVEFGLNLFKENLLFGGGWGGYMLRDLNGSIVPYDNHCAYIALLARGGMFMAIPTFLSYYLLTKKSLLIRKSSWMALSLMLVFLLLSYGNAGVFNYTICSIIPLVVLNIKKELYNENQ